MDKVSFATCPKNPPVKTFGYSTHISNFNKLYSFQKNYYKKIHYFSKRDTIFRGGIENVVLGLRNIQQTPCHRSPLSVESDHR